MERIPDTSYALIDTAHWPSVQFPILLAIGVSQPLSLFSDSLDFEILDTNTPLGTVDVVCDNDGVSAWPRRDGKLDLRIALREFRQR